MPIALWSDPFDSGYRLLKNVFSRDEIIALAPVLTAIPSSTAGRRWAGDDLAALTRDPALRSVPRRISAVLPGMAVLRVVAFRKDAGANWFVPAHQDRSIPIPGMVPPPGFSNVTRKDGGWLAEAPIEALRAMMICRIFVDQATRDDGPLEVIRGTHRRQRIGQADIPAITGRSTWEAIVGAAGDMAVLSPLLLHRSRRAAEPSGRRVLQIECIDAEIARHFGLVTVPLCSAPAPTYCS